MTWPDDNPYSAEKTELGRHLFYDFQLSINGTRSCGVCHEPAKGFTDGFIVSVGAFEDSVNKNSLSLLNVGYRETLTWSDPSQHHLESQMLIPMTGEDPIEMGIDEMTLRSRLEASEFYPELFGLAFEDGDMSLDNVIKAIGVFERTIVGGDTSYDRWLQGDDSALSPEGKRGIALFLNPDLACSRCHGGLFFDSPTNASGQVIDRHSYANTGVYNIDGHGSYPETALGVISLTGTASDMGVFRVPSLRGVTQSGPWLHDGSALFLEDILRSYARGGRLLETGPYPGDGADNPYKSELITGFEMSDEEMNDLMSFFSSLSDSTAMTRPELQSPFCQTGVDGEYITTPCIEQVPVF